VSDTRNQAIALPLEPLPGRLQLSSNPSGATVVYQGSTVGETPVAALSLPAGPVELLINRERYQPARLALEIRGKDELQEASVELEPDWAEVTVDSIPQGAEILVDGMPSGIVTPGTVEALSGEREISLQLEGHQTVRQQLLIAAGRPMTLEPLTLKRADRELNIVSQPAGAGITLNGIYQGETPLMLALDSRTVYRLRAYKAGYGDYSRTLRLQQDATDTLTFRLTRETGRLVIRTDPPQATVRVNNRSLPATSDGVHQVTLPTSAQRIAVSLDGYAGYSTSIEPKAGLAQEIRVKLLTVAEARRAALKPTVTTAAGQLLVLVEPSGKLTLGASRREPGRRANETLREVTLSRLFYLGEAEVTNAEFKQFSPQHDSGSYEEQALDKDDMPVTSVSWIDAALYCNWLSERDQLTPFYRIELGKLTGINAASTGYRLPTEAEWRFAANQVEDPQEPLRFPWGSKLPPPDRHGNYADRSASNLVGRIIFGYNDNYIAAAPIKQYAPNLLELHDLGGNVAEWSHDYYEIPDAEPKTDPLGPTTGEYHVIKGASWMSGTVTDLRLSYRDYGADGRQDVGFRIARYAEEPR
ncbi:MAG: PEGA domain-containing protein, partial [Pseudomonadota bacterium]